MLIMQKRQSTFIKNSDKAYGKDVYYRFIKENAITGVNFYC